MVVSASTYTDRLTQAIIQKAVRILMLTGAPLGVHGEVTEFGMAVVRPDYQIREMLAGMMFIPLPDLETLVTTDMVIRQGLQVDPDDYPTASVPDVERAIGAACSWIEDHLTGGVPFA